MFPIWRAVTAIGLPITLSTGSVALGMGSVNRVLTEPTQRRHRGLDDFAAHRGHTFGTLMGVSNALVPFIAFNYGRRSFVRIKEGIRAAFIICGCVTLSLCFLLALYPWPAIGLFRPEPDVAHAAVRSLRITMAGYPFAMYGMIYNALFIATGSSVYGFLVQISRCMAFRLPMAWFLAATVSMSWVWLSSRFRSSAPQS